MNNELYKYTLTRNQELQDQVAQLNRALGETQGKLDQQSDICRELIAQLAAGTRCGYASSTSDGSSIVTPKTLVCPDFDPNDYVHIKFWTRDSWRPYRQGQPLYTNHNNADGVPICFQNADGSVITKACITKMYAFQRSLWEKYRAKGILPDQWSKASSDVIADHRRGMYDQFPELALCKGHYKVAILASEWYSGWSSIHKKADSVPKTEPTSESTFPMTLSMETSHSVWRPKCPASPSPVPTTKLKRGKITGDPAMPTSRRDLEPDCPAPPVAPLTAHSLPRDAPTGPEYSDMMGTPHDDHEPMAPADDSLGDSGCDLPIPTLLADETRRAALLARFKSGDLKDPILLKKSQILHDPIVSKSASAPLLPSTSTLLTTSTTVTATTQLKDAMLSSNLPMSASMSGVKQAARLRVTKHSMTARNLTAIIYLRSNPAATVPEYANHCEALLTEDIMLNETRSQFAQAYIAKNPGAVAEAVVHAFEQTSEDDLVDFRAAAVAHLEGKQKKARTIKGKEKAHI
ncbi:hypothetical protein C8Q77DRAFT_1158359 [Trametes polyzona]|nr:hypothetical protein C8Q77DRAFT_1158359 [Trametes polyzona]